MLKVIDCYYFNLYVNLIIDINVIYVFGKWIVVYFM